MSFSACSRRRPLQASFLLAIATFHVANARLLANNSARIATEAVPARSLERVLDLEMRSGEGKAREGAVHDAVSPTANEPNHCILCLENTDDDVCREIQLQESAPRTNSEEGKTANDTQAEAPETDSATETHPPAANAVGGSLHGPVKEVFAELCRLEKLRRVRGRQETSSTGLQAEQMDREGNEAPTAERRPGSLASIVVVENEGENPNPPAAVPSDEVLDSIFNLPAKAFNCANEACYDRNYHGVCVLEYQLQHIGAGRPAKNTPCPQCKKDMVSLDDSVLAMVRAKGGQIAETPGDLLRARAESLRVDLEGGSFRLNWRAIACYLVCIGFFLLLVEIGHQMGLNDM